MANADPTITLQRALARDTATPLLVAFSGGLDSTALLHALVKDAAVRASGLRAVHVHHGLQTQADAWATHCDEVCGQLEVGLEIARVAVDRSGGEGLEAAARKARHLAFSEHLRPGEVLVTAHHRDDQAETFLLRALRGSGVDGLSAMRPWRPFAGGRQWRPLLDTPHQVLRAYALQHGLSWIEDPSNQDPVHDRNFLRSRILPLLRERWPHASDSFSRGAMLCAEASDLLLQDDALALALCATADPQVLSVRALQSLPPARRARVLRQWVENLALPALPGAGVARIESDLLRARADAAARFRWRDAAIERWRDLLHAQRHRAPLPRDWRAEWDGRQALTLPGGDRLSLHGAEALPATLRLSARRGGERITLPGRMHSHALKHVLQELGVPPWERAQLPLLSDAEDQLCAVADLAYSARFDAWLRQRGARLLWSRAADPAH